ncbi:MAG: DUF3516 domain-containing protein [Puniceicoccaceae bacterium]|nr:MAG: DUF3516 domain-containing protein [Puniceicoccaceae bacterium]
MDLRPLPGRPRPEAVLDAFLSYVAEKGLELYPAQERAILELLEGRNVILNTPTGSGKSLVAAALHFAGLCAGRRSVYTCPIKALVNEKFLSLCREFGPENVGMSTGDASVNRSAPVLCCTAEVLANIALHDGSAAPVHDVVMDEFHYYSDRDRGVAWQVPLLALPQCRFLLMSATLGETSFFECELTRRTGRETVVVASVERPVPLAFSYSEDGLDGLVLSLHEASRLPAYLVHFTQRAATETAQKLMSLDLCSRAEKDALAEALAEVRFTTPFGRELRKYLRHGIGVHHAGLLPRYRLLVEKLAQENRLRLICGTDTLGVGVNVPIRTVVFTALSKYDGDRLKILPIRDFHQIAGRAGRKGFDDQGYVVAQAPEHEIENRKLERKAKENPAKARKFVRRKPPERFVNWDEKTFLRLQQSLPEPLTSSFRVGHGMLLNVLSRPGDGCRAMRDLIRDCHEPPSAKAAHRRRAFSLFRSLVEKDIIELLPRDHPSGRKLRLNLDLQDDFSLDQALALFLVDAVVALDRDDPGYSLKVLSLVEAVLENPDAILRRQVDRLKSELLRDLKDQGVPYEERMEKLDTVEHPKPEREFIYETFNGFAARHPWVGEENIRPKSIAREMVERYSSFNDYVKEYGLERAEGLLLRHLTGVYKTLTQTVPEDCRTEEVEELRTFLEQLVRSTDSSLLDEWEALLHPEAVVSPADRDAPVRPQPRGPDPARDPAGALRQFRHAVFSFLKPLSQHRFRAAAEVLAELAGRPADDAAPPPVVPVGEEQENEGRGRFRWNEQALVSAFEPYQASHERLLLDPSARAAAHTRLEKDPLTGDWLLFQTLVDPEGLNDWGLTFRVEVEGGREAGAPRLSLESLQPLDGGAE